MLFVFWVWLRSVGELVRILGFLLGCRIGFFRSRVGTLRRGVVSLVLGERGLVEGWFFVSEFSF